MAKKNTPEQEGIEGKPVRKREREDVEKFRRITSDQRNLGGAPLGSANPLKHGAYANRFLDTEEMVLFDALIVKLKADFKFNESSDFVQVELAAMYFLKLGRAQESGDWDTALKIDQAIRGHLKDLKMTKIAREGDEPRGPESSPAEWACNLLQKWEEAQTTKRVRKPNKPKKTSDNTAED